MYFLEFPFFFPSLDSAYLYNFGTFFIKLYSQCYTQEIFICSYSTIYIPLKKNMFGNFISLVGYHRFMNNLLRIMFFY